ncbi:MAG TPA: tannase/feruloyl esterase family alpha/beta hydrolase [Vicinamibacterales bacterium]|jgi:feruloyl esterase|nr:tannase/feruloyl esterase family alpha/beta hydrolase [Vicinamibacterales bacterium]
MKFLCGGLSAVILAACLSGQTAIASTSCESLASLVLEDATITTAATVAAGAFRPPAAAPADGEAFKSLASFCRVAVTLRPSRDSDIKVEVWMPASGWNGKFQAVGNGGWAGTISYGAMSRALAHGYATSSTDTGHTGGSASFALGHPEKLADYAYRSEHEMTVKAKAIIDAFYRTGPKLSYWNGCSTGGRQALTEAQRFPDDYDGIIAGAAANPKTHLDAWRIWMAQAMFKDEASVIPVTKFPMIHKAVLAACDAIDGLKDGLIDDPTKCHFDPQVLECKSGDAPNCLTVAQVTTAQVVMSPPKDRKTGGEIFPGFEPGTELGWERMLSGPGPYGTALDQFKYIVFGNPLWDWRTFDLERDVAIAEKKSQGTLSSIDPKLTAFARHGGKLLMYHGWSDQDIAPRASVNFYGRTLEATSGGQGNAIWVRLFMVPGMGHCGGGEGPNTFDMMTALEPWVEKGTIPERVVATHRSRGEVDRTRPLCAYPQVARYMGTGSIDDAANFVCKTP